MHVSVFMSQIVQFHQLQKLQYRRFSGKDVTGSGVRKAIISAKESTSELKA